MFKHKITNKTIGEIRTFLDAIANGNSYYKSLHNLTEQIEHQYHGRFLIELIQNAHDALLDVNEDEGKSRITIILAENEKPYGSLYIANDGNPFTESNFKSLCQLGQSDKDPEKSIGNKGIGFRSVLEISNSPEIFSRSNLGSSRFDGYCFRFQPDVINQFRDPIRELVKGNIRPSPLDGDLPLVEWDQRKLKLFRSREDDTLEQELACLSPYLLPIPSETFTQDTIIRDLEQQGFVTVIRLPLLSDAALALARKQIDNLREDTVLFLDKVRQLQIIVGEEFRTYERAEVPLSEDQEGGSEVWLSWGTDDERTGQSNGHRYWIWKREIGGEANPEELNRLRSAVASLPGKWPELERATISIAVRVGELSDKGILNIYLPTGLPSGCAAHFNAPFYGDMSRTNIDFEEPLNKLLFNAIAEKTVDVVLNILAGKGPDEAAAIIDLLSPCDNEAENKWCETLAGVLSDRGIKIYEKAICLTDKGWNCPLEARLLSCLDEPKVLTDSLLREVATFPVIDESLSSRKEQIQAMYNSIDLEWCASCEALAATIEKSAEYLHARQGFSDWNGFWNDVELILDSKSEPLVGKKIILGTDNQLHASDKKCAVFFRPRSGGTDDEVVSEGSIDDIPENLRPFMAFLHESIRVHVPREKGGVRTTPVHAFLSSGLVETFGVEQILRNVLVEAIPQLPVPHNDAQEGLCRDVLQWGLRLVMNSSRSRDKTLKLLGRLPAPCLGGWYPISGTSFGPGWSGTVGKELEEYLRKANTVESQNACEQLLLPPDHPNWGNLSIHYDILKGAGVLNGLRLIQISDNDWESTFLISRCSGVQLPVNPPPGFNVNIWKLYRKFVKDTEEPYFEGDFHYEIQDLRCLPGLDRFEEFSQETHEALMKVIMASLPIWEGDWSQISICKLDGRHHRLNPKSPLFFVLSKKLPWLIDQDEGGLAQFLPKDRWYIPNITLAGRSHQFSHLRPLPSRIASELDSNDSLVDSMMSLGMPKYDPEAETDNPRLLEDLASALDDPESNITDQNVFIGQVRTAWNQFSPSENSSFPHHIIVRRASESSVITPSKDRPVYLPDATAAVHEGLKLHLKPVIEMEPKDAKRLKDSFRDTYGGSVQLASELVMRALVNEEAWNPSEDSPLLSAELPWLPPVILAVFAFHGDQSRGTSTKTFTKAMNQLRNARHSWVDSLKTELLRKEKPVAITPLCALWLSKEKTLLADRKAREKPSQMSEALASLVNRGDLETPLKLVLGHIGNNEDPAEKEILSALKELHITQDRYAEAQQLWLGDLSWVLRLLRPLVLLLNSDGDLHPLAEVNSENQLLNMLGNFKLSPLDESQVLTMVRSSSGFKELGQCAYERIGDRARITQWNRILSQLGEPTVKNDQADDEFQSHLNAAKIALRSVIRAMLRNHPEMDGFQSLDAELFDLHCPSDFAEKYWNVGFHETMSTVADYVQQWCEDAELIDAIREATSVENLRSRLKSLNLEPDIDPIEIQAENHKKFIHVLKGIQKVAIAWCLKKRLEPGVWEDDSSSIRSQLSENYFSKKVYIDFWNESDCLEIMRSLSRSSSHIGLWNVLDSSASVEELRKKLGLSEQELHDARGQLEKRRQAMEKEKKSVDVCGKDFCNDEDNLINLYDHIVQQVDNNALPKLHLEKTEQLQPLPPSKKRPTKTKKVNGKPKKRPSQAMSTLIGLAGEIYAYQILQN